MSKFLIICSLWSISFHRLFFIFDTMKRLISFLPLLLSFAALTGQKEDNVWFVGGSNSSLDSSFYKSCIFNFDNGNLNIEYIPKVLPFDRTNSSICDAAGTLLCLSNGENIYNKNYEIIENGGDFYPNYDYVNGYPSIQSFILLPLPGINGKIVHVYGENKPISLPTGGAYLGYLLRYAIADMNQNNGLGKVISKHLIGGTDTLLPSLITATRHGNGRDWWIMAPHYKDKIFYRYLLTQEGIKLMGSQSIELKPLGLGQVCFSPDGQWYARFNWHGRLPDSTFSTIELYRFDRCTGLLSDFQEKTYSQNPLDGKPGGVAFSNSSRFMYVSRWDTIYQYDMQAPDILASEVDIAGYDGFLGEFAGGLAPTRFYSLQLAPDNKIYCAVSNYSSRYLHVIDKPEEPGLACDVQQHSIYLPVFNKYTLPNIPYYRLGKWAGSPCDTLGSVSGVEPVQKGEIRIFPNPATDEVLLYFPECNQAKVVVWNIAGQLVEEIAVVPGKEAWPVDVSSWAAGTYIIAAYMDAEKPVIKKLVVAH